MATFFLDVAGEAKCSHALSNICCAERETSRQASARMVSLSQQSSITYRSMSLNPLLHATVFNYDSNLLRCFCVISALTQGTTSQQAASYIATCFWWFLDCQHHHQLIQYCFTSSCSGHLWRSAVSACHPVLCLGHCKNSRCVDAGFIRRILQDSLDML